MAHEIKLDVYTIRIKTGKNKLRNFDDLELKTGEIMSFTNIFKEYIKSFNNQFWIQNISGKAITLSNDKISFASKNRIIYGQFEGGTTGLGSKIKKRNDTSDETAFQVTTDDVSSIPYYFLIWFPSDSNLGLLISQSFSSKSFSEVLKGHLKRFFNDSIKGSTVVINEHFPSDLEKQIKEKGAIKTISLRRLKLPSTKAEKLLGLNYIDDTPITVEIKISGLSTIQSVQEKLKQLSQGRNIKVLETESLDELGIDGHHDTILTFEHNGKIASGKQSQNFKLSPSYYVDEQDIQRNNDNHVTLESIHPYSLSFLEEMKKEIGYTNIK